MLIRIALVLTICCYAFGKEAHWDYGKKHGPSKWGHKYPYCNGKQQSPIDIQTSDVETDYNLGIVDRKLFWAPPTEMSIMNNGHTLQFTILNGSYEINEPSLLPFTAVLAQYHFHWGSSKHHGGSEHTINGKHYFGELHAVHYNKKYGSTVGAIGKTDGLAVFAWFIDIGYPQDNLDFERFLDLAKYDAKYPEEGAKIDNLFSLETFLPPGLDVYYRYSGSFTTPPCYEYVTWTVFDEPIQIFPHQATKLAWLAYSDIGGKHHLKNNFRPTQPLYGRKVTKPPALVKAEETSKIVFTGTLQLPSKEKLV